MKIYLTRPRGPMHKFEQAFIAHWHGVSTLLSGNPPYLLENNLHETHGELLTRLWNDLRGEKEAILISESDFWPFADEVDDLIRSAQRRQLAACFTPLSRRDTPDCSERVLEPLVAPWFILLHPSFFKAQPPLDWLRQGGPFNDAANLAYLRGVEAGCFLQHNVKWLTPLNSLGPKISGCQTKYLHGVHSFFTRHWNDPPATRLLPNGYDVQTHLAAVELWLTQRAKTKV